jgi:hypothetical protein
MLTWTRRDWCTVAGRGSEQKRFGGLDVTVNQRHTRRSYGEK